MNSQFTKEDIQMANKNLERCLPSLVIRKMLIEIIIRYQHTLLEWLKEKKSKVDPRMHNLLGFCEKISDVGSE